MSYLLQIIKKHWSTITILLSLAGIGIMAYYNHCDTACSYLKGDIWGIDLKWVGMVYMSAVIGFAFFKQKSFVRALLAAGLGVEVHLYAFQVQNDVYCPFCLAFSVMLILSFIINYEIPTAWYGKRNRLWLYFLGEVEFPRFRIQKLPLLMFSLLGYLTILLTFSGSVTPAYAQDSGNAIPSLGKGPYEVEMFADYFCTSCLRLNDKSELLMKDLLNSGQVKITFVDVPIDKATPIYVKYYLYAAHANAAADQIFKIRKVLFDAAQNKNIRKEKDLAAFLKQHQIGWKNMDEKSVFPQLSTKLRESSIRATPTCIIKYSANNVKKYIGDDEIWKGLTNLKSHVTKVK